MVRRSHPSMFGGMPATGGRGPASTTRPCTTSTTELCCGGCSELTPEPSGFVVVRLLFFLFRFGLLLLADGKLLRLDRARRRGGARARRSRLGRWRFALVRSALGASGRGLLQVVELRAALEADVFGAQVARHRPPRRLEAGRHIDHALMEVNRPCRLGAARRRRGAPAEMPAVRGRVAPTRGRPRSPSPPRRRLRWQPREPRPPRSRSPPLVRPSERPRLAAPVPRRPSTVDRFPLRPRGRLRMRAAARAAFPPPPSRRRQLAHPRDPVTPYRSRRDPGTPY